MNYNFEGHDIAVVQRIINETIQLRDTLMLRKSTNLMPLNNGEQRRVQDAAELQEVTQSWQTASAEYAAMPEGMDKIKKEGQVSSLNSRRVALIVRLAQQGDTTLPERQFTIATLDARIPEAEEFITALQTRITELGG